MTHFRIRLRRAAATAAAAGMFALPVAGVAGCGGPAVSAKPTPSVSSSASPDEVRDITPGVTRQLDTVVRRIMREANIPGVTVGLWTPDGNYVRSFGLADQSNGQAMSPDLSMRIGSVTKTFTVTALLQLVDRHKVNLDDPIGKYVEGVPNGSKITLRELAGMRSGLFNYSKDEAFYEALTNDPHQPFTPKELLGYAFQHHALFPPGKSSSTPTPTSSCSASSSRRSPVSNCTTTSRRTSLNRPAWTTRSCRSMPRSRPRTRRDTRPRPRTATSRTRPTGTLHGPGR